MFLLLTRIIPLHCIGAWHSRHLVNIYGKKEDRKEGQGKGKRIKKVEKGKERVEGGACKATIS